MGSEDWYRGTDWSPAAQAAFEAKLARSRSSKSQYLAIQGNVLAHNGQLDAAESLVRRVLEIEEFDVHIKNLHHTLANIARKRGDMDGYIDEMKIVTDFRYQVVPMAEAELAEALLDRARPEDILEARRIAEDYVDEEFPIFVVRFAFRLLRARIAEIDHDIPRAQVQAEEALAMVDAPPILPRKPYFGVVNASDDQIRWLYELAGRD